MRQIRKLLYGFWVDMLLILTIVGKFLVSRLVWKRTALIVILLYSLRLAQDHYYTNVFLFEEWHKDPTALYWNVGVPKEDLWYYAAEQTEHQNKLIDQTRDNAVLAFCESVPIFGLGVLVVLSGWKKKADV